MTHPTFDSITQNSRVTNVKGVLTLFARLHAHVRPSVMHVVYTFNVKMKQRDWEVKWHNLLLEICRRVKASGLHLITQTGDLQSYSPLIVPIFITFCQNTRKSPETCYHNTGILMYSCLHGILAWMDCYWKRSRQRQLNSLLFPVSCQTWHLFLQWSQLPVCLSTTVKSVVSFSGTLNC